MSYAIFAFFIPHNQTVLMKSGYNEPLVQQIQILEEILQENEMLRTILNSAETLQIPNWYIGAGVIVQTVWNHLSGFPLTQHILDLDFVYFDADDLSEETENRVIQTLQTFYREVPIRLDIKNQARVHLWFEQHFGHRISPYTSIHEAINTWPTTASCIGVKKRGKQFIVYAPFGLNELFGMIVRANKVQVSQDVYLQKSTRWKKCWPDLNIIPWEETVE